MLGRRFLDAISYHFIGSMDDVRFYDRVLGPQEIAWLYQAELNTAATLDIQVKTVDVVMNLSVGVRYILESSFDLHVWNPVGGEFVADFPEKRQTFDALATGRFFRIRRVL